MADLFTKFTTPAITYVSDQIPRLCIAADGPTKSGRSYWSFMTTPQPIVAIVTDVGTKSAVDAAVRAKRRVAGIMDCVYEAPKDLRKASDIDQRTWDGQKAQWAKVVDFCQSLHTDRTVKTLVIDKANNLNSLLELAYFGKLKGNMRQDVRTDMNTAFHNLFWELYKKRPDLNMVWIHDQKKQYVKTGKIVAGQEEASWNGKYEREGHGKIGAYVDLTLTFGWEPIYKDFFTEIDANNPLRYMVPDENGDYSCMGKRWYAKADDYPSRFDTLATAIFPETETDPGYWE